MKIGCGTIMMSSWRRAYLKEEKMFGFFDRVFMKNTVCTALLFVLPLLLAACSGQIDPRSGDPFDGEGSAALTGTLWEWDGNWGYRTLTFESAKEVVYSDGYYDPPEKTHVRYIFQETGEGLLDIYGPFSKNGDRLIFTDWKKYGHGAEYILIKEEKP